MAEQFNQRLLWLQQDNHAAHLCDGLRGLEKESLRVAKSGGIAQTPHPQSIGSALANPWITTDYSEALCEFITPPLDNSEDVLCFLQDVQTFVYRHLHDEKLWATSMPCILNGGDNIPLAVYGNSNAGTMKTVYRRGLGYRYGRVMQVISGVHFNYSLPQSFWHLYHQAFGQALAHRDFVDQHYMGAVRNVQRYGWIIPYLMGASPAVCKSFFGDRDCELDVFDTSTFYEPYATSLRMGDIGYQNSKEEGLGIKADYSSLSSYINALRRAISTPAKLWQEIGVEVDGQWRQLNANILQIENEYYSTVRPKAQMNGMDKPINALRDKGISYIELRSLDVNAYHPLGINQSQLDFLEVFIIYCVLQESPVIHSEERREIDENLLMVAHKGRTPLLKLKRQGGYYALKDWGLELLEDMRQVAVLMDRAKQSSQYVKVVEAQRPLFENPDLTPSAVMLREMREHGEGFYAFANRMSQAHHSYFTAAPIGRERLQMLEASVKASWLKQRQIEAADTMNFADFMRWYEAQ